MDEVELGEKITALIKGTVIGKNIDNKDMILYTIQLEDAQHLAFVYKKNIIARKGTNDVVAASEIS